jgi:large subunit ribosomal protein L10
MSSNLERKKEVVAQLTDILTDAKSVVLVEYQGTTSNILNACRGLARAQNVTLKITKNTLVKKTLKENDEVAVLSDQMHGPLMYIVSKDDMLSASRVAFKCSEMSVALVIKSGMLEGKHLTSDEVKKIANIPNKEVLVSMLLSTMLQAIAKFVRVVDAIKEKKQSG